VPDRPPRHAVSSRRSAGWIAIVVLSLTLAVGVAALTYTMFGPTGQPGAAAETTMATSAEAVGEPTSQAEPSTDSSTAGGSVDIGAPTVTSAGSAGPDACTRVSPADEGGVEVTGVGDSIMLSASAALESVFDGAIVIDAEEGRQFAASVGAIERLREDGELAPVVVVHLGTNGAFSDENFDDLMASLSGVPRVVFLNVNVPRDWEPEVNEALRAGVDRWPTAELADWQSAATLNSDWFVADGYHLSCEGIIGYAGFVAETLAG
jgi:hypothetical protein